ncbi:MAG: hypothetical protein A2X45_16850 [Lentisphaerae bacterium GWF2_50_93]|nr:MAG: hypothetical protein A2X45_16850 [Lentisphaerae bacterium GWF2_50_93]
MKKHLFYAAIYLAVLCSAAQSARAESLEFRSEGFFASSDGRIKLFREPWFYTLHLDVDGKNAVNIVGPIFNPGYQHLTGDGTKIELDTARRQLTESGTVDKIKASCRRTITELKGGLLVRMEAGDLPPEVKETFCRLIFPVEQFKDRRVRWDAKGDIKFPAEKPADTTFLNDWKGENNQFRFELGNGQELGVKFLSPVKSKLFADCRAWDEKNYHMQITFSEKSMVFFLCLLQPDEAFPEVDLPNAAVVKKTEAAVSEKGATLKAQNGLYDISISKSGQVSVQKKGAPAFSIDVPYVRENGALTDFTEDVVLEKKDNRIEVVSKIKDKPLRLRQSFSMEDDGWLSISAQFEGLNGKQEGQVALVLPAEVFAGKSLLAGNRFVPLSADAANQSMLYQDWNGSSAGYELLPEETDKISLSCDQKASSRLIASRTEGRNNFRIEMKAKDGAVKYRLHFSKQEKAPAYVKGNLLKEGASFEVGADGVRPYSAYSWNEKMADPGVPPVFDSTTAVHGTTSLKLTASDPAKLHSPYNFAFVCAIYNRIPLKRGQKYTVSAWMKADKPGVKANIICAEESWGGNDWGAFPVTTEWKRYSFPFFTSEFKKGGYCLTWVGIDSGCKEGSLWIDAVQVEEGDLADFQASTEVEYGIGVENPNKLFESGSPCKAVLKVRNNGKAQLDGKVDYVIKDYWEKPVLTGSVPVRIKAESAASYPMDFGKLPCGYYRGYFTASTGEVEELIFGVYVPQPLEMLPEDWPLACHNDPMPIVRKLGFGSVRAFGEFQFANIAAEKGKFDFSKPDRMLKRAEECGLTIMPILGDLMWPYWRHEAPIPKYALEKLVENPANGRRITWAKLDAWKDYVRALTSHYKGKVTAWEVLNEPNLWMTPEEYLPYLKASYEAAKEGNPDCNVVGVCATSDFAGKPGTFTDNVFKQGGTKYFDTLSMHLYDTNPPERTIGAGSDVMLETWRKIMKETYGKETSVWHTEKSYIPRELAYSRRKVNVPVEYCEEPQFFIPDFKLKAEYLLRETLLGAIAGGKGKFFWFGQIYYDSCFITIRYHQPYVLDHTEFDLSPCPELIAANGLARVLTGMSHPFRQLSWGDLNRCSVFTGDKGSMAAMWNWKDKGSVIIPVGKNKFIFSNFFGEPIEIAADDKGEITVELDGAPKYLSFPGKDGEAACGILKGARLLNVKTDMTGSLEVKGANPALRLKFRNTQLSNVSGTVEWPGLPKGFKLESASLPMPEVAPGEVATIEFPITEVQPQPEGASATAMVKFGGQQAEKKIWMLPFRSKEELMHQLTPPDEAVACPVKDADIKIDGDLSEWSDDEPLCMAVESMVKEKADFDSWQGPADCSVLARLRWSATHLYVGVKIFDDVVMQNRTAQEAYACDCLELFLDVDDKDNETDRTSTEDFLSNADDFQALFAPASKDRPQPTAWWMQLNSEAGTRIASKPFPGGYTLEIAVPWSAFKNFTPAKGKKVGFSLAMDDADQGYKRKTVLVWKGDTSNYKRPNQWGKLLLK